MPSTARRIVDSLGHGCDLSIFQSLSVLRINKPIPPNIMIGVNGCTARIARKTTGPANMFALFLHDHLNENTQLS